MGSKISVTRAIRALRDAKIAFTPHTYRYEPRGGTAASARALGIAEHLMVKTLIMETDTGEPFVILMHGDKEVSTKALARHIGVGSVAPCDPKVAQRHSGYMVGGTSPFGLRKPLPVYAEASIATLPRLVINGGKRGLLVELDPADLAAVLEPEWVTVARDA
ncbi:MAG: aminoacyl-tRNA deacylase [Myxococcota bacterium]